MVAEVRPLFATEAPFLAADVHPLPATEVPFLFFLLLYKSLSFMQFVKTNRGAFFAAGS